MKIEVRDLGSGEKLIRARATNGSWVWVPEFEFDAVMDGREQMRAFREGVKMGQDTARRIYGRE